MKYFFMLFITAGILSLSSCAPKSSMPCPHVYKIQKTDKAPVLCLK